MENDMNFFDLCVLIGRAIGRCFKACWKAFLRLVRLTYRYWWVVLPVIILALTAAMYLSRKGNKVYKMNAVAQLNGASIQQFEQAYAPLQSRQMLPSDAAITPFVESRVAVAFETFRVIDCLDDGTADYVDFKRRSSSTDTIKVQMKDQLCLQFRIKERNMDQLPQIEEALMAYLNANEAMQSAYAVYLRNLQEEVAFNHSQAHKLDSLTSHYYFSTPTTSQQTGNGVNFYGDRHINLFLNKIYAHQKHLQESDYKLQLATAPVVLVNHFAADRKPVNGRLKLLVLFFLLGWISGGILAELIDKRKALCAWLKA